MSFELLYTSAPSGLKQGSRGFSTVLCTQGAPSSITSRLETLSGFRHVFPPGDPRASLNPITWSHVRISVGGRSQSVLSRIAAYGVDYSGRTNKLAHHLVLETGELPEAGPAWLLAQPGFMRSEWDGRTVAVPTGPSIPRGEQTPGICERWRMMTGDAGLGGMFAENTALDTQNAQLREDLAELEQEISQLESDYVAATDSKQETLRLPRVSTSHSSSFIVLLKGARAYLAYRPGGFGSDFHLDHVTTRERSGGAIEIEPKAGAGWNLDSSHGIQELSGLITQASSKNSIMTLAVWPDAYDKFSPIKDELIEKNVPYQLWLEGDDPFLTVYRGSGAATVQ